MLCRNHFVGRLRHHRKSLLAQLAGEIARQIGAGEVEQRAGLFQHFRLHALGHEIAQRAGVAAGDDDAGEAGLARRGSGVFADREQRQFEQGAAGELRLDAA